MRRVADGFRTAPAELVVGCIFPFVIAVVIVGYLAGWGAVSVLAQSQPEISDTFRYATDGLTFFVLPSAGPDGDYDIEIAGIPDSTSAEVSRLVGLVCEGRFHYSVSNGIFSSGDILRFGTGEP